MNGLVIKTRRFKLRFRREPKWKKTVIYLSVTLLLFCVVAMGVYVRHWQFSKRVFSLQQEAVAEMKQKTAEQRVLGDYTGDDIETLQISHLSINPAELIAQYGVGFIRIPAVGMELPILEGMTQANLSIGAGTVKANQQIGQGNFALLGHYMTSQGLLFGSLEAVSVGDEVEISFYEEEATYEVKEKRVIHESEGQYMLDDPDGSHWLTLLTCNSDRVGSDYRIMVRAILKES